MESAQIHDVQFNQTKATPELNKALSKAQGEFPAIDKNRKAMYGKYADLANVIAAVVPVLNKHGLTIRQKLKTVGNDLWIETILAHESGEFDSSSVKCNINAGSKMTPEQRDGSAITYYRRYALCALISVCADDDADGNEEAPNNARSKMTINVDKSKASKSVPAVTPKQRNYMIKLAQGLNMDGDKLFKAMSDIAKSHKDTPPTKTPEGKINWESVNIDLGSATIEFLKTETDAHEAEMDSYIENQRGNDGN